MQAINWRREVRIAITGGGTGGHVYPALAVIDALGELARQGKDGSGARLLYLGGRGGIERDIARRDGLAFREVATGPLRGRAPAEIPLNLARMCQGFVEALVALKAFGAQVLLATGGYVCVPVVLAAWTIRTPILIYLPDVAPGWAIRFLSRFADVVAVTLEESKGFLPACRVVVTGYPVRQSLGGISKELARRRLELDQWMPVLLVAGGSRGAHAINVAVGEALTDFLNLAQVVHVSGWQDEPWLRSLRDQIPDELKSRYRLYPYMHEDFVYALSAADLAISRAGASVLGEYTAVGLPSILIPYPHAGSHQRLNALALAERGAALVLENDQLSNLLPLTRDLLSNETRLRSMASAAKSLSRPEAARSIAELLLELTGYRRAKEGSRD